MITFVCPTDDCDGETFVVKGSIRGEQPLIRAIECTTCGTEAPACQQFNGPSEMAGDQS